MNRYIWVTILIALVSGLAFAQDGAIIDCDVEAVIAEQARLSMMLDDYDEQITEDKVQALTTLQMVVDGYNGILNACDLDLEPFDFNISAIGDVDMGQALFETYYLTTDDELAFTCTSCHSTTADGGRVAPSFNALVQRMAQRMDKLTPLEIVALTGTLPDTPIEDQIVGYLYTAIINPNLSSLDGYHAGIMPEEWGRELSRQQVLDIIAYLLTLEDAD